MSEKDFTSNNGLISPDMSGIELKLWARQMEQGNIVDVEATETHDVDMNTHISLVTGLERPVIKAIRFSEVYGSSETRDELIQQHGKGMVIKMTLDFLAKFPATTQNIRFRKERSRLMLRALVEGVASRRNTDITYDGTYFRFLHKRSVVLYWNVVDDMIADVTVDKYEGAPSTLYQRTIAREAIHEFRKVILNA